jgi:Mitochondrial carrier protein
MGGGNVAKEHPVEYLLASGFAAAINYPLWRASAIGQSGFHVGSIVVAGQWRVPAALSPFVYAFAPPYKGVIATVAGMTWARAAIFWGSDYGRIILKQQFNAGDTVATVLPPLLVSTAVQLVNMPLVRATITIQDPKSNIPNVPLALQRIYREFGVSGLWHGTSAGIMKTVPKYCTAIVMKDIMEEWLPEADPSSPSYNSDRLWRSAYKSAAAGITGAILTNPLDVIRNEMFKTNMSLSATIRHLYAKTGYEFISRGMDKNMIAVAIPIACTIFFTDAFIQYSKSSTEDER